MRNFLSYLLMLVGAGLLIIALYTYLERTNPHRLAFNNYQEKQQAFSPTSDMPERIVIQKANVDLPILQSKITNHIWESTANGVSYLTSSPVPGSKGNSIMYGHNWENLLGSLRKVTPGDTIVIHTKSGSTLEFVVKTLQEVTPSQTSVLANTKDKRLTIYTCTGFMDSKRLVVTAFLKG